MGMGGGCERSQAPFHSWLRGDTTGAGRLLFSWLSGSSADSYHAILAAVKIYRRPRKSAASVTSHVPQVTFLQLLYSYRQLAALRPVSHHRHHKTHVMMHFHNTEDETRSAPKLNFHKSAVGCGIRG